MTTVSELQELVASRYGLLDLPTWPDPHHGGAAPRDDEYSRLTDPGRYRIVHARARAWAAVLENAVGARSEVLAPAPTADPGAWRSTAGSALSLAILMRYRCYSSSVMFLPGQMQGLLPC